MSSYASLTDAQLQQEMQKLQRAYCRFQEKNLSLDMSRGKPGFDQVELSMGMLSCLTRKESMPACNYGLLDGMPQAKQFFADMLGIKPQQVIIGGNSSLNFMYDAVSTAMLFGFSGEKPWCQQGKIKFLCPVPGYDRHFAICELMGIEMISVPMDEHGPDMDQVEEWVNQDPTVKGIWCVPKYSNPTGISYSDEVVRRFGALKPAAKDFRLFWDNAYIVHHLIDDDQDVILNIFDECAKHGNDDMVIEFTSTSKVTFPGGGIAVMASSEKNITDYLKVMTIQTIGHDKLNQLRHCKFLKDQQNLALHMKKHAALLRPKFDLVQKHLQEQLDGLGIASWTKPKGGYFISFMSMPGCAQRIGQLCKDAGVILTSVGATYPYGIDPDDANIRIAPTFPPLEELDIAMQLFCLCVKMASIEKMLNRQQTA